MNKCKDCINFSTYTYECIIDEHDTYPDDESCSCFKKRKDCEHKFEKCYENCSIICHRLPSERGCEFHYECDLDDFYCDEKCELHKDRYKLNILNKEKFDLVKAKESIEKSIKRYDEKINEIEAKLKNEDKKNEI